eukprot:gene11442-34150_t
MQSQSESQPATPTKSYNQALAEYYRNPDGYVHRIRKGKGETPPDAAGRLVKDEHKMMSKLHVPGANDAGTQSLLQHHGSRPTDGKSPSYDDFSNFRPSHKMSPTQKPISKPAVSSPRHKTTRVIVTDGNEESDAPLVSSPSKWEHTLMQAKGE